MRDKMIHVIGLLREESPEATLRRYREAFPQITPQEALEAKELFFKMIDAPEQGQDAAIAKYRKHLAGIAKRKA